jgi:putative ABC transport system ATP-binding protein/lipoprotein-releasing system ATP-binding protein
MNKGEKMVTVEEITKIYNVGGQTIKAVDQASFTVNKGEMAAIAGHSGSGKTTLLSLIGGLTRPDSGTILIDKANIWTMDDDSLSEFRNKKISFIYQFASLISTLTAIENVILPTVFGKYEGDIVGYAKYLLKVVGLEDKMQSYPAHLSGGQQRRVAIARAFINKPDIILADEPTGDLDEETEKEIIKVFQKMNKEDGITFIIATHSEGITANVHKKFKMSSGILTA